MILNPKSDIWHQHLNGNVSQIKERTYQVKKNILGIQKLKLLAETTHNFGDDGDMVGGRIHYLKLDMNFDLNFRHDLDGNKQEEWIDAGGNTYCKSIYKFNDQGIVDEVLLYYGGTHLISRAEYTLDHRDYVVEEKRYNESNQLESAIEKIIDDKGFAIQELEYNSKGKLKNTTVNDYDDFDVHGNWRINNITENGKHRMIVKREYEYY